MSSSKQTSSFPGCVGFYRFHCAAQKREEITLVNVINFLSIYRKYFLLKIFSIFCRTIEAYLKILKSYLFAEWDKFNLWFVKEIKRLVDNNAPSLPHKVDLLLYIYTAFLSLNLMEFYNLHTYSCLLNISW